MTSNEACDEACDEAMDTLEHFRSIGSDVPEAQVLKAIHQRLYRRGELSGLDVGKKAVEALAAVEETE